MDVVEPNNYNYKKMYEYLATVPFKIILKEGIIGTYLKLLSLLLVVYLIYYKKVFESQIKEP